mmetsp:Transcript_34004/g.108110  ORF Transcript_34004/g.108110 Transcript_34004/m.108110 type:complete len:532 (+) Transcript_34004:89-1684(+)
MMRTSAAEDAGDVPVGRCGRGVAASVLLPVLGAMAAECDLWGHLAVGLYTAAALLTGARLAAVVGKVLKAVLSYPWALTAVVVLTTGALPAGRRCLDTQAEPRATDAGSAVDTGAGASDLAGVRAGDRIGVAALILMRALLRVLAHWARLGATASLLTAATRAQDSLVAAGAVALHVASSLQLLPDTPRACLRYLQYAFLLRTGRTWDVLPGMLFLLASSAASHALRPTQRQRLLRSALVALLCSAASADTRAGLVQLAEDCTAFAGACAAALSGSLRMAVPALRDTARRLLAEVPGTGRGHPAVLRGLVAFSQLVPSPGASMALGALLCCPATAATVAICLQAASAARWVVPVLILCSAQTAFVELTRFAAALASGAYSGPAASPMHALRLILSCDGTWAASAALLAVQLLDAAQAAVQAAADKTLGSVRPGYWGWVVLVACIIVDVVGMLSMFIPPLEALDVAYAPVAFLVVKFLVGGWVSPAMVAAKELLPFTDWVPAAIAAWFRAYPEHVLSLASLAGLVPGLSLEE